MNFVYTYVYKLTTRDAEMSILSLYFVKCMPYAAMALLSSAVIQAPQ